MVEAMPVMVRVPQTAVAAKSRAHSAGAVNSMHSSDLIEAIKQQLDVDTPHAELPGEGGVGHPELPVVPDRIAGGTVRYLHPAGLQSCLLRLTQSNGQGSIIIS